MDMNKKKVIVWFRNDLRVHDNEALQDALDAGDEIYPVYVFDDRVFKEHTDFNLRKTGKFRARFIIECVEVLRSSLQGLGTDLIIRSGIPEDVVFELAKELKTSWVFCNRERTREELNAQDRLEQNLWAIGQEVRYSRGKMLYYTADLPFPITHTPEVFTQFRKEVEKIVPVRLPIEKPDAIAKYSIVIESGDIPEMKDFGFRSDELENMDESLYKGGELEGLKRLNYYLWETDLIRDYKETRNGLLGKDYSSKLSAYLAHGCLSPKTVYHEIKRYEQERVKNDSTYHLFFELLWRDFFRLMGKKHGDKIFLKGGIKEEVDKELQEDEGLFRIWCEGRTGMPFVDAAMLELNTTGYMSNRSRQNVASFLVNDLKINWQMGAAYFESQLLDYDPCSNWCNWNYISGVGNDPKEGRYFNMHTQAKKYDSNGDFVKHWIPALRNIPADKVHQPFLLTDEEQVEYNCILQKDYPDLCVKKESYIKS